MKMLEEVRAQRPNWRQADLHDLRIRFTILLAAVETHMKNTDDPSEADRQLWRVLYADRI